MLIMFHPGMIVMLFLIWHLILAHANIARIDLAGQTFSELQRYQPVNGIINLGQQGFDLLFAGGRIERNLNFLAGLVRLHGLDALQLTHFHFDGVSAMSAMDGGDGVSNCGHGFVFSFEFCSRAERSAYWR